MRKLAWAALGFAVAAGLAEYVLKMEELPLYAAALAVLALVSPLLRDRLRRTKALILCLSAALGLMGWWGHYRLHVAPSEALVGETVTISAAVNDYVERHADYERVEVTVRDGAPKEKALLYLYEGTLPELEPGELIQAQIKVTSAVTRQGARSRIYTSQNQNLLGYIQPDTLTVTGRADHAWRWFPQRLSHALEGLCDSLFPADTAPFVKGLLTGNTLQLEEDTENYTAMRTAGVMHIVAVSGMHMFVLVAFLQLLLGKGKRTSLLCLPLIGLYALMAGCKASVVRAAVMQTLYLTAPVVRREPDGTTSLGAALLLLLAGNPMAIGGVGLQLSFACMAGLVYLLPKIMGWMEAHLPMEKALVSYGAGNVACTLSATAFSVPLSAAYFGQLPLYSLVANLLTLFVVECVFSAGFVVCAVGALRPSAGVVLAVAVSWAARLCMWVYRAVAALPAASLPMDSVKTWIWLAGVYVLFALWYALRRRGRKVRLQGPVCAAVAALMAVLVLGKLSIRTGEGQVAVLDVGQGECVVLANSQAAVVVDCGGSGWASAGDIAANYLLSIGKTRVDMLVLTHLHADHANGAETLLYRTDVGQLVMPEDVDDTDWQRDEVLYAAERQDVPVTLLTEEKHVSVGGIELELLLPMGESGMNERGIVVLATMGEKQVLIMGDAGREAESALLEAWAVPDVDVLVAGHHGSRSGSSPLFLLAAQPETAVVSVGYNAYGLPAPDVMDRLDTYCDTVLRTDEQGNVVIQLGEEGDGSLGETGQ